MITQPIQREQLLTDDTNTEKYLAIDLGAESGRAVLGSFNGEKITLKEIGRFSTSQGSSIVGADNIQRWEIFRIRDEIERLIHKANQVQGLIAGVGVDSWGVDIGFFDSSGHLLDSPVCYRDKSHAIARRSIFERLPEENIWDESGIQSMSFNTLYQLEAIRLRNPKLLDKAQCMLLIPDVLHTLLSRQSPSDTKSEFTDASTTQMLRPGSREWNYNLLTRLGIPSHFLRPISHPGDIFGTVKGVNVPIYAPATHDTASAVAAIPAESNSENWAFLSSGTWSLIGVELPSPMMSHEAMAAGFSNEGGIDGKTRFLKNIMGLWILQEVRRCLAISKETYTYSELTFLAQECQFDSIIDATDERLLNPENMIQTIQSLCRESNQAVPQSTGELVRCSVASLAMAYRQGIKQIEQLTGREIGTLHLVGGGSQNELLNQWTADACGVTVLAGPTEAAALGNILGQMIGSGSIANWSQARLISKMSFLPTTYHPNPEENERWNVREEAVLQRKKQ